tara:strand:+ start:1175 stop:2182 length:1008 start_codon:yes stop_codon:yes gene_type:complete
MRLQAENDVLAVLRRRGLVGADDTPPLTPLAGGVSSDIWKVDTSAGPVCIKRALAKLKTAKEWFAPVERNAHEADWMRIVADIVPAAVPEFLFEDPDTGLFAMRYLDPADYPVWKELLRDGEINIATARAVGDVLGAIHAATAGRTSVARRFAHDAVFQSIRIEPYLLRTAQAHPDLADRLAALAETTERTKLVLVHGDVSPKNILVGPVGPVFLDAECAWYGDPAFDLAFCLNHLLLKCIWRPQWTARYLEAYSAMTGSYLSHVDWESAGDMEARAAALLPALLLARIDGTSPVEYIVDASDKDRVRKAARAALVRPAETLAGVCRIYRKEADL